MSRLPFHHLLLLEPLGLLYGSSGRLLSPETLTGRAAEHFPPDSPTIAGLIASQLERPRGVRREDTPLWNLHTAGPFCFNSSDNDLWLPAPFTLLQEEDDASQTADDGMRKGPKPAPPNNELLPQNHCKRHLIWQQGEDGSRPEGWHPADGRGLPRKSSKGGWIRLRDWQHVADPGRLGTGLPIYANPWQAVPHLHPRLRDDERVSALDDALFLEYGIAFEAGFCLAYLSSHPIPEGRYRFGGEGHLVELRCVKPPDLLVDLLQQELSGSFALITPGLWGGPRLSRREPLDTSQQPASQPWHRHGIPPAILTERPRPWRHQLGSPADIAVQQQRPRLSRGRWAVPAGTCYRVEGGLPPWVAWHESWFPREGFSFKQFGTALALPLHPASA
jgi:CRISPR-associated protein Cmr3